VTIHSELVAFYENKTQAILRRYGPGPRVHYHTGLVEEVPIDDADAEGLRHLSAAKYTSSKTNARFDWDHCRRMRAAIVEAFVDRDLSPATFGQITTDDNLFAQLAESVAANKRGRRFLRNVRDALKEMNPDHLQRRISILEELM
jgi:hypothetical protein